MKAISYGRTGDLNNVLHHMQALEAVRLTPEQRNMALDIMSTIRLNDASGVTGLDAVRVGVLLAQQNAQEE